MTLPLMALGGHGVISVASNQVPSEMVQLVEAMERGALDEARQLHRQLLQLMMVNFIEPNPIPVKFAMASMGLCEFAYRLPMVPASPATRPTTGGSSTASGPAQAATSAGKPMS